MDDYMSKPIKGDKLQEMVERWLVSGNAAPAQREPAPHSAENKPAVSPANTRASASE
jgi:DNA-binding NtrC family response regulator